jgi:AcrR family transcriptional regulator
MRTAPTRADRRNETRAQLIAVAERRFSADGYHATSLDAVADEAGFTKGAVYSNFSSKEDLFFAVYERRVERFAAAAGHLPEAADVDAAVRDQVAAAAARRDHEDGWLAVFFEFWAHVLRHPEHRARFAELHGRAMEPFVAALDRLEAERGPVPGLDSHELATTMMGVSTALGLERLTRPDVVGPELAVKVNELFSAALRRAPGGAAARGDGDGSAL